MISDGFLRLLTDTHWNRYPNWLGMFLLVHTTISPSAIRKGQRCGSELGLRPILALSLINCVLLGKLVDLLKPPFPLL